jgi:hypothetical protein
MATAYQYQYNAMAWVVQDAIFRNLQNNLDRNLCSYVINTNLLDINTWKLWNLLSLVMKRHGEVMEFQTQKGVRILKRSLTIKDMTNLNLAFWRPYIGIFCMFFETKIVLLMFVYDDIKFCTLLSVR